MQLKDKTVIVTGAGSGIGRALVARFMAEGAKYVLAADVNLKGAEATATEYACEAMKADVSNEADVKALIDHVESSQGPIDLYCSNAGIGMGRDLNAPNEEWQKSWDVNVMAHVYAARHLVPLYVARGGGYFMNTSSAAGLLNQIAGAAYGTTKHAAVGFGEWLALTYAHKGIKVSMLCPQAVRTAMTAQGNPSTQAASVDGMMEPETLADAVVNGLAEENFLILPHPEVLDYMRRKTSDYDRWIGGMNRLQLRLLGD